MEAPRAISALSPPPKSPQGQGLSSPSTPGMGTAWGRS